MQNLIRTHSAAIFLACVVSCATFFPQMIAVSSAGQQFEGVYPETNDDAQYYLARAQEVYDGHHTLAQPYLWEGKDGQPLQFWIPDVIAAYLGKIFRLDPQHGFLMMDAVFPFVITLLTYSIGFVLTKRRMESFALAAMLHLGLFLTTFGRPISPQLNFIPLLLFLFVFLLGAKMPSRINTVLLGITFGVLFHIYTYYWTYAVVVLGLYFFMMLLHKNWQIVRQVAIAFFIGGMIAIPYVIQLWTVMHLPTYAETVQRLGMLHTHFPSGILIVVLGALYGVCALIYRVATRKIEEPHPIFIAVSALCLAAPLVTNQHIITGGNLEFSSHYRTIAIFATCFGFAYLFARIRDHFSASLRVRNAMITLIGMLIGVSFLIGLETAYAQSRLTDTELSWQRYNTLFVWLNKKTEKDTVVFADDELSTFIPAYTHNNVFFAHEATLHFMSNAEVWNRFLIASYFEPEITEKYIFRYERSIWGTYYINNFQHGEQENTFRSMIGLPLRTLDRLPKSEMERFVKDWTGIKQKPFRDIVAPYRVDYIIWDKQKEPWWNVVEKVPGAHLVFEDRNLYVYQYDHK